MRTESTMVAIAAMVMLPSLATASVRPAERQDVMSTSDDPTHFEVPDGAYVPVRRELMPVSPAFRSVRNGFVTVQVNVDGNGDNIVGDAANEPSLAVDSTNPTRMAIGWRQFDTIQSNFRQAGNGHTTDGGRTWTFPGVIDPGVFRSDPVLDADAEGNFYYNSLTLDGNDFICTVYRSADGGKTWDNGVFAWGGDKQWMAIDRTGGIGHGNIYANWTVFFSVCDGQFTRSYDGGDSYLSCIDVPNEPQWGTLTVGGDGAVYIAGTDFFVVKSSTLQDENEPVTFDFVAPVDLGGSTLAFTGPNPGGLLGQVWIGVDGSAGPNDGNVYMLATVDPPGNDPADVMFARSLDGGASWEDPVQINDDQSNSHWQWMAVMSVAPNGRIDTIWNDTRNNPGTFLSHLRYSFSSDGGVTWSPSVALTPSFDPHVGWPQQQKIGDYYDMVSDRVGADLAFAATFNGEQDVYYVRLRDYDCNDNGVGDSEDIANETSQDLNDDGIPDECQCLADLDQNGAVEFNDILVLLAAWGPCNDCPEDIDGNGAVEFADLLIVLAQWGQCP